MAVRPADVHLDVQLNRLRLANPVTVASGTFGYAREMAGLVDLSRLGGILPKTITQEPRAGNPPPRTVETAGGMLNSIGLDNDGIEAFLERQLPYLASLGTAVIVSIAGQEPRGIRADGGPARRHARHRRPGTESLLPERHRRGRFRHQAASCEKVVAEVRAGLLATRSWPS